MRAAEEQLRAVVAPVCAQRGLSLFDLEVRNHAVQVTVEGADALNLEAVAEVSRAISEVLDANEKLTPAGHFDLEVTSPGLERRLRRPEHFAAAVGEKVALRLQPGASPRRVEGVLVASTGDELVISSEAGEVRISPDDIERAHTVFDWKAALAEHKQEARASARAERTTTSAATGGKD